jgi:tetratricopeptide (TPR) repeat protein
MAARKQIRVPKNRVETAAPPPEPKPAPAAPKATKPKHRTRTTGSPLAAFLVISVVIGLIVVTVIIASRKDQREQRQIALLIEGEQAKAHAILKSTEVIVEKMIPLGAAAPGLRSRAEMGVRAVLGEPLRKPPRSAPPAAKPVVGAPAGSPSRAAPPSSAMAPPQPPPVPRDESVPVGILTREELDARRNAQPATPPPARPPATPDGAPSPPPPPPPRSVDRGVPEIRRLADALLADTESIEANVQMGQDLLATALREGSEMQRETRIAIATKRTQALQARLTAAEELLTATEQALAHAEQTADKIDALRQEHLRAEADRKQRDETERLAREHAALVKRELAMAEKDRVDADALIAKNLFEKAFETADGRTSQYRSKEALARHAVVVEQCRELVKLKEFLAAALKRDPMAWGWKQEPPSRDIIGADRELLYLKEKQVKWEDVSQSQLTLIILHYLGSPKVSATLQTDYGIPLGIYFAKAGKTDEARRFTSRAIALDPTIGEKVERLVPLK